MSAASDFLENELLDHVLNGLSWTSPPNVWIGLSTADPGEDEATLAEPVGNGYVRAPVAGSPRFTLSSNDPREAANAANVDFPTATGSWGTLTYFAIFDAVSGGNMLIYAALSSSLAVVATDTVRFVAGDLVVTLD